MTSTAPAPSVQRPARPLNAPRRTGRTDYSIPVYRLSMVRDSAIAARRTLSGPADAISVACEFLRGVDREHTVAMLLDTKHRICGINTVSIGQLDAALVHPREVYKPAIIGNAAALLIAHNHPTGNLEPSPEDLALTERLREAGEVLGIPLLDSLIVDPEEGRGLSLRSLDERNGKPWED